MNRATREFADRKLVSPRLDAEVLLARCLGADRVELYKYPAKVLTAQELDGFQRWVERRLRGEPVAYITGRKEFWSLDFEVNHDVLIPRPDTEILVEEVLKVYGNSDKEEIRILDVGTGSGAIIIALALELKDASCWACDISAKAVEVARRNAETHGVAHRISFSVGDLFTPATGRFDCIVSNPPYIDDRLYETLSREVKDFEPRTALSGGPDGMQFHRRLIREGKHHLKEGGRLFMEIGPGQKEKIADLFRKEPAYEGAWFRKDYGGIDRCVTAWRRLTDG
ncbi:MAG: peptide chain release factor N(5)-glutamine methyltransferase [Deltaproteobacteria bacterium]|nr:peptide chain release factor N(5)-glutamine methyltransferase [Deltaproteobacteria bacterium]